MAERVVIDIREAYYPDADPRALRIPLGSLLADPGRLPRGRAYVLIGHDENDAGFAARFLRERGLDVTARR